MPAAFELRSKPAGPAVGDLSSNRAKNLNKTKQNKTKTVLRRKKAKTFLRRPHTGRDEAQS
jgi:hypothetical protein